MEKAVKAKRAKPKTSKKQPARKRMSKAETPAQNIIALIYDFDGTLCPKNMQEYAFLPKIKINPKTFWKEVETLSIERDAEPLITYMHLMYQKAQEKGVHILRDDLVAQGREIEFCPGVEDWFALMDAYVKERTDTGTGTGAGKGVEVRHYLISSGLKEIVEGTSIYDKFYNVFASEYYFDAYQLPYPKRVITDTSKTQYLFRINKGVEDVNKTINSHMPVEERPIPFSQMIYFGDGETDVPSMAVTRQNGGAAIAVYPKSRTPKICKTLFEVGRVDFYAEADYRVNSKLYQRTIMLIDRILCNIRIENERAKLG